MKLFEIDNIIQPCDFGGELLTWRISVNISSHRIKASKRTPRYIISAKFYLAKKCNKYQERGKPACSVMTIIYVETGVEKWQAGAEKCGVNVAEKRRNLPRPYESARTFKA